MSASRRRLLQGAGLGALALGVGAGVMWRQGGQAGALGAAESALWAFPAEGMTEQPLLLSAFQGKRVVVNFWATWCAPCVEELPLLSRFHADHAQAGWQVVGLALDQRAAVTQFLRRVPVEFPVGLAGAGGVELMRQLGNDRGGLPFTVVLDRQGVLVQRKIGQLSSSDLKNWLQMLA